MACCDNYNPSFKCSNNNNKNNCMKTGDKKCWYLNYWAFKCQLERNANIKVIHTQVHKKQLKALKRELYTRRMPVHLLIILNTWIMTTLFWAQLMQGWYGWFHWMIIISKAEEKRGWLVFCWVRILRLPDDLSARKHKMLCRIIVYCCCCCWCNFSLAFCSSKDVVIICIQPATTKTIKYHKSKQSK